MAIRIENIMKTSGMGTSTTDDFSADFYNMLMKEKSKLNGKEGTDPYAGTMHQNGFQEYNTNDSTVMVAMYESFGNRLKVDRLFTDDSKRVLSHH